METPLRKERDIANYLHCGQNLHGTRTTAAPKKTARDRCFAEVKGTSTLRLTATLPVQPKQPSSMATLQAAAGAMHLPEVVPPPPPSVVHTESRQAEHNLAHPLPPPPTTTNAQRRLQTNTRAHKKKRAKNLTKKKSNVLLRFWLPCCFFYHLSTAKQIQRAFRQTLVCYYSVS